MASRKYFIDQILCECVVKIVSTILQVVVVGYSSYFQKFSFMPVSLIIV